jgi:hypothetical protein
MALKPCLDCGHPSPGSRCPPCTRARERPRQRVKDQQRTHAERQRRRAAVAQHVAEFGWWCPGWGDQDPHPSTDLTADHVVPVSQGGLDGPPVVRCRTCNGRRGARAA